MNISNHLHRWLEELVRRGGSDLFLVSGLPPTVRVTGTVLRLDEQVLDSSTIEEVVLSALSPHAVQKYRTDGYVDSSLRLEGFGRFRINLHHERGRPRQRSVLYLWRRRASPTSACLQAFLR